MVKVTVAEALVPALAESAAGVTASEKFRTARVMFFEWTMEPLVAVMATR
jgi:hypothetical protein